MKSLILVKIKTILYTKVCVTFHSKPSIGEICINSLKSSQKILDSQVFAPIPQSLLVPKIYMQKHSIANPMHNLTSCSVPFCSHSKYISRQNICRAHIFNTFDTCFKPTHLEVFHLRIPRMRMKYTFKIFKQTSNKSQGPFWSIQLNRFINNFSENFIGPIKFCNCTEQQPKIIAVGKRKASYRSQTKRSKKLNGDSKASIKDHVRTLFRHSAKKLISGKTVKKLEKSFCRNFFFMKLSTAQPNFMLDCFIKKK